MPRTRYAISGPTLSIATTLMGTGLLGSLLGVRSEQAGISAGVMGVANGFSAPLYALGSAYTYDWMPKDQILSASTALLMTYSLGAVCGPLLTAAAMTAVGVNGFFWALIAGHIALAAYLSYRMVVSPDRAIATIGVD